LCYNINMIKTYNVDGLKIVLPDIGTVDTELVVYDATNIDKLQYIFYGELHIDNVFNSEFTNEFVYVKVTVPEDILSDTMKVTAMERSLLILPTHLVFIEEISPYSEEYNWILEMGWQNEEGLCR